MPCSLVLWVCGSQGPSPISVLSMQALKIPQITLTQLQSHSFKPPEACQGLLVPGDPYQGTKFTLQHSLNLRYKFYIEWIPSDNSNTSHQPQNRLILTFSDFWPNPYRFIQTEYILDGLYFRDLSRYVKCDSWPNTCIWLLDPSSSLCYLSWPARWRLAICPDNFFW